MTQAAVNQALKYLYNNLLKTAFNMVYPHKCRLCGRLAANDHPALNALNFGAAVPQNALFNLPAVNICRHCLATLKVLPRNNCPRCGCVTAKNVCVNCQINPPQYVNRTMALLFYNDEIGNVIKRFKYNGDLYVGRFLSLCLLAGLAIFMQNDINYNMVLPVPLHPKKLKRRKFNQTERLLGHWHEYDYQSLPGMLNARHQKHCLTRLKETRSQAGLNSAERARNMANAFAVDPAYDLNGLNILLADDIVTTGATIENCAKALKARGAARVDVIAIARTMPHLNPGHLLEI